MRKLLDCRIASELAIAWAFIGGIAGCNVFAPDRPDPCGLPGPTQISLVSVADNPPCPATFPVKHDDPVSRQFAAVRRAWDRATLSTAWGEDSATAWNDYNLALRGLIHTAIRSGRFDSTQGLAIQDGPRFLDVPIAFHDFPWSDGDFQQLVDPPTGHEPLLQRRYRSPGIGAPFVVTRSRVSQSPIETRFYPEQSAFSATAVLRFDAGGDAVLEFYNPVARPVLQIADRVTPIAADLSANLAWVIENTPRTYLAGFIDPGETIEEQLRFLEPYQPGKVPIVFLHGLFSDPQTTADLINDLRAAPGFADGHQVWIYRYPTGQGMLQSAAGLREELQAAAAMLDPGSTDPALRQMVLVGHSMGGLIAKLQVTHSEEKLWNELSNRPLEQIQTSEATRSELTRLAFFDPSPNVNRVIFIATPHRGGLLWSELVGNCATKLVEVSQDQAAAHAQLIADNPGTFHPLFERRFPNSVDMLSPDSPLLSALRKLHIRSGVSLHSIIGDSHAVSWDGPSDGVVSVRSAMHPGCQSTLFIDESHSYVHRSLDAAREVLRILQETRWQVPSPEGT